ncbi:Rdx family-domain-containing protein [Xylaria venustula]|nr:Rdx family-domain-containing protein [Xylaria venustula]
MSARNRRLAAARPTPRRKLRFPDEDDEYGGRNIRHVIAQNGFDTPPWFYAVGNAPIERAPQRMQTHEPNPKMIGTRIMNRDAYAPKGSINQTVVAAYCHFPTLVAFKCYIFTEMAGTIQDGYCICISALWPTLPIRNVAMKNIITSPNATFPIVISGQPANMINITAILYRIMEADPLRFNEVDTDSALPGAVFSLGHSLEDWSRALQLLQAYMRARRSNTNKYKWNSNKASTQAHGHTLNFVTSRAAARAYYADIDVQNETLLLSRTWVGTHPSLGLDPEFCSQAYDMIDWSDMDAFVPNSVVPAIADNPNLPALTETETRRLIDKSMQRQLIAKRAMKATGTPTSDEATDPKTTGDLVTTVTGIEHGLNISVASPVLYMDPETHAISRKYIRQFTKYYFSNNEDDGHERNEAVCRIMRAVSADPSLALLLTPARNNAGLVEHQNDAQQAILNRKPPDGTTDCGASLMFHMLCQDDRIPLPTSRHNFLFFLTGDSPVYQELWKFAQELLSTFSTSLGEVALQPATGGVFVVEIHYTADPSATRTDDDNTSPATQHRVLWDRKTDGGFPETKELKRRVRDVIEPGRNLGHVDRDYPRQQQNQPEKQEEKKGDEPGLPQQSQSQKTQGECEDCR